MKKACGLGALAILLVSCVTLAPPPPSLYIENLPQSLVTPLTLEERIQMEEAWDYLRQGRLDRAEKAFLRLGPTSPLYSLGLGYVYLLQDYLPEAEEFFNAALEENAASLLAQLGLAQVYQKTGEEDKEFNALREVLKLDPLSSWAKEEYGNLKSQKTDEVTAAARDAAAKGDATAAEESFLRALHYSPESVEIHLALASLYLREDKISNALVHFKAAADGDPENVETLRMYAATLAEDRQYERSLDVYQRVLELDGSHQEARKQVEVLKDKLGIVELPSRYNEIPLAAELTREDMAALLAVRLRDILTETPAQPPIIVDISASWASKFILRMTSLGLIEVHSNHTFQPKRIVTRAELAETLFRIVRFLQGKGHRFIHQIPPSRIQVRDVSPDHYYSQPISQILAYQIMELYPDRTFRPNQPVSGAEAGKTIDILLAVAR